MDEQKTTVLQGVGLFKIWTTLILTPVLIGVLILFIVIASKYQKNWTQTSATAVADVKDCPPKTNNPGAGWTCALKVNVEGLPIVSGGIDLKVDVPRNSVAKDQSFPVVFDPSNPTKTLTTKILTPAGRKGFEIGLGLCLLFAVVIFVVNLTFRKNKTWQSVSGVMQGADIASSIFHR